MSGEVAKAAAVRHALAVLGREVSDDEAEALCMALYAQRELTPKAKRRRSA